MQIDRGIARSSSQWGNRSMDSKMWVPFCAYQAIVPLGMPAVGMDPRDIAACYRGMDCLHVAVNLGSHPMMATE